MSSETITCVPSQISYVTLMNIQVVELGHTTSVSLFPNEFPTLSNHSIEEVTLPFGEKRHASLFVAHDPVFLLGGVLKWFL